MTPESYSCDLDQETGAVLRMYLFTGVRNADAVRDQVTSGSWHCAAIKPSLILDPLQVAVAANRAALARLRGAMVTRSVYAEILFNLSLSKNISRSLTEFGVERDRDLLVCFLASAADGGSGESSVVAQVAGEAWPMSRLRELAQPALVRRAYRLPAAADLPDDALLDAVVTRMATKTFVSH